MYICRFLLQISLPIDIYYDTFNIILYFEPSNGNGNGNGDYDYDYDGLDADTSVINE